MVPAQLLSRVTHRRVHLVKITVGDLRELCEGNQLHPQAIVFANAVAELGENEHVFVDQVDLTAVEEDLHIRYREELIEGLPHRVKVLKPRRVQSQEPKAESQEPKAESQEPKAESQEPNTISPLQAGARGLGQRAPSPAPVLQPPKAETTAESRAPRAMSPKP